MKNGSASLRKSGFSNQTAPPRSLIRESHFVFNNLDSDEFTKLKAEDWPVLSDARQVKILPVCLCKKRYFLLTRLMISELLDEDSC